jgi:hypothetical protein
VGADAERLRPGEVVAVVDVLSQRHQRPLDLGGTCLEVCLVGAGSEPRVEFTRRSRVHRGAGAGGVGDEPRSAAGQLGERPRQVGGGQRGQVGAQRHGQQGGPATYRFGGGETQTGVQVATGVGQHRATRLRQPPREARVVGHGHHRCHAWRGQADRHRVEGERGRQLAPGLVRQSDEPGLADGGWFHRHQHDVLLRVHRGRSCQGAVGLRPTVCRGET